MSMSVALGKLRRAPVATLLRRLRWYRDRLRGTLIAATGNTVRMDGMTYSVASPQFSSTLKATLGRGRHEQEERDLVRRWLPADVPLVELGGGLGVVSCLANHKLAHPEQHVVVEANPAMVPVLSTNRAINGCRFTVINRALGYDDDTITLDIDTDFVASSAVGMTGAARSKVQVKTTNVGAVMREYGFERCGIVCDVEGTEAELVAREFPKLGERIRYIMAETHPMVIGRESTDQLLQSLRDLGFAEKQTIGDCIFYSRD